MNLGKVGENIALTYLTSRGYHLKERNHSNNFGELDLIVVKGKVLVFVEVKTVTVNHGYDPVEQMTPRKLIHLRNAINGYLAIRNVSSDQIYRLDFIGIIVDEGNQVVNFDHRPSIGISG